jgi:hypothetical protein
MIIRNDADSSIYQLMTADDQIEKIPYAAAHGTGAFGSSLVD